MKQEPPKDLIARVVMLTRKAWFGEICEYRVVSTKAGADVMQTGKSQYKRKLSTDIEHSTN